MFLFYFIILFNYRFRVFLKYEELSCIKLHCLFLPVAPIKALCSQCFESWNKKFGPLGLSCKELTGDTEIDDFFEIQDSHIILTTPVCNTVLHLDKTNTTNMKGWEDVDEK